MIVTIVGTGYVGLVTGACLASQDHTIRCVDVSEERIDMIRAGKAPFYESGLEDLLQEGLASGRLSVTTNLSTAMEGSDLSLIAVGTPSKIDLTSQNPEDTVGQVTDLPSQNSDTTPQGRSVTCPTDTPEADLSFLETAAYQIGAELRNLGRYHVVAVKSTVIPGTTRRVVQKILEAASGMKLGEFGLCMNPEFLREGTAVEDFMNPDRIVIGQADTRSGDFLDDLYRPFACEKLRVGIEEAELTKYASNALLSVVISFGNEIASLCEATPGTDVETVMEGLFLDRRLSPTVNGARIRPEILAYMRAGIGFGGSCLPKDVSALRGYGKRHGVPTHLLDAVMTTNANRPARVVKMAETALGGLTGKTIALVGVAFKPGTDDLRNSPAISILHALWNRGARVQAYDPFVSPAAADRAGLNGAYRQTLELAVKDADAALLTTADPALRHADWERLISGMHTPVLIDGRNVLRNVTLPARVRYYPIGKGGLLADERCGADTRVCRVETRLDALPVLTSTAETAKVTH
jgi:UDPglucose 6-dehydrogenase